MEMIVYPDAETAARQAATRVAQAAREAVAARGRFVLAVSGGQTPWPMFRALPEEEVPWAGVHLFQVDERVAPAGHPDRNLTHLRAALIAPGRPGPVNVYPMPVEAADLPAAAKTYAETLEAVAGSPPVLDLVHLGLGGDGHTASLVPGDAVLTVEGADVALTGVYQGRRRMTLTYPLLDRARQIVWLVAGADKRDMLRRLLQADRAIPAGRVSQSRAIVLADRAAAE